MIQSPVNESVGMFNIQKLQTKYCEAESLNTVKSLPSDSVNCNAGAITLPCIHP